MNEELNVLYTDEGYYRPKGAVAGKKANLYVTNDALIIYKGSLAKEFTRQFGLLGGLVGGTIAGIKENNKNVIHAVALKEIKKISPKKSFLTGARIDFEQSDGESFNFAGTKMGLGGLQKCYQEIVDIVKAENPNVITE